jgi:phosphoribosylanthranilate isomerase
VSKSLYVKICGITNPHDANIAMNAGADALGFNFYPRSKRYIDINAARSWLKDVPTSVARVAILVNPKLEEALAIFEESFIDCLQLHGDESSDLCRRLQDRHVPFVKAVRPERDLVSANFHTRRLLLDSDSLADFGGSGKIFPWKLARAWIDNHPEIECILAGGLTSQNVAAAIREVRPFGVDVTTGVEASPGRKDGAKVRDFIGAARAATA